MIFLPNGAIPDVEPILSNSCLGNSGLKRSGRAALVYEHREKFSFFGSSISSDLESNSNQLAKHQPLEIDSLVKLKTILCVA